MLNKYNSTVEILCLSSHVFFFYPAKEQESSALKHSKKFMLILWKNPKHIGKEVSQEQAID
jgi:hypothetical protein